jgi:hypothetical protein
VTLDRESDFSSLLMDCDLEIACETCTTSMESWIIGKPTTELVFERHPVLYHPNMAALQPTCDDPAGLPDLVRRNLAPGAQDQFCEAREKHLEEWCDSPAGCSSEKVAQLIADGVAGCPEPDWGGFGLTDCRRTFKMRLLKRLDLPYNYNPFLKLFHAIAPRRYAAKMKVYEKTPKPADVRYLNRLFNEVTRGERGGPNPANSARG